MSNIDKQALREAANAANTASWGKWESYKPHKGARGYEVKVGVKAVAQHCLKVDSVFIAAANPSTVLALLDELESVGRTLAVSHEAACSLVDENDELNRKLEAAEKRIAELQSSVIAPGIMRCAGCGFVLTKNNINMAAGTITAGDNNTEPCPNGCGPLWPVTWKEQALQMRDDSEQWFEELQQSRQRIAELEAEKETLRPVGVMSEGAFRRLENSESRFIALWPRPGIYLPRKRPDDGVIVYARTAAGIGVKGE
ncbi:ead/Ea22-like family protein [Salmonella enterica]|nr:ead/Ea22-like family protein [Salmonella enterica]